MVTRRPLPASSLLALAILAGCADPPSVLLTVEHDPDSLPITQIEVVPTSPPGLDAKVLPKDPGAPLGKQETLRLNFGQDLAGSELQFKVRGLYQGKPIAGAATEPKVTLSKGADQPVTVQLLPWTCIPACISGERCFEGASGAYCLCGTGRCQAGQVCRDEACVCTPGSCPDGCCGADGLCHPGGESASCGLPGGPCSDCKGALCQAGVCGVCTCSGCCRGTECVPAIDAHACAKPFGACVDCAASAGDACSALGECTCGGGAPCATGTRCVSGTCVCDRDSCPDGCCQGTVCRKDRAATACGTDGAACVDCTAQGGDGCDAADSTCRCGSGAPCPPGTRCEGGACVCDATSCPDGCCANGQCVRPPTAAKCGLDGKACQDCGDTADQCLAGSCSCGVGGAKCLDGQRCTAGQGCVCDEVSCPDGCCEGGTCVRATTVDRCGTKGGVCSKCAASADGCTAGVCTCGGQAECKAGTTCSGGLCQCSAATCTGCCDATGCNQPSLGHCGAGGATCTACDFHSNECLASGACGCNGGAPCAGALHCTSGGCVCDATACPAGCCGASGCQATSATACAPAGDACQPCDPVRADGCGTGGTCTCRGAAACAAGQHCTLSGCVCDATSCPGGCCIGTTCTALGQHSCAAPGAACGDCGDTGDGCSASGGCTCGGDAACPDGQLCSGGACVCDPASCLGCCQGSACLDGNTMAACGQNGAQCQVCDLATSNLCSLASCRCGAGAACTPGAKCVSNVCKCDATTCLNGCCDADGKTCVTSRSVAKCGPDTGQCVDCGMVADGCSAAGACTCGGAAACPAGTRCSGGACVCDTTSGCSGCCDGNTCRAGTDTLSCGAGGAACAACVAPAASQCVSKTCYCGGGPPCTGGQVCDGTMCVSP